MKPLLYVVVISLLTAGLSLAARTSASAMGQSSQEDDELQTIDWERDHDDVPRLPTIDWTRDHGRDAVDEQWR